MKVCLTHVKTYKKASTYMARREFVKKLVKAGMPEYLSDKLMNESRVHWEKEDVDAHTIYVAEIIDDNLAQYEKESK